MQQAKYDIVSRKDGWGVAHDGEIAGSYITKEAAFEAAVVAASDAIKQGQGVTITVQAGKVDEPALGKR